MLEQMAKGVANPTLHLAQNIRELLDKHYKRPLSKLGKKA
jgi:hypothetical protein